jgi:hypothetical protein
MGAPAARAFGAGADFIRLVFSFRFLGLIAGFFSATHLFNHRKAPSASVAVLRVIPHWHCERMLSVVG